MQPQSVIQCFTAAYAEGKPLITDSEFDAIQPQPTEVGVKEGDRKHAFRMYSLKKVFDDAKQPFTGVVTPKLDGAAISLLYVNGILTAVTTRGDGITGKLVNKSINGVPRTIDTQVPLLQITGEVVADKSIPNARNYASGALHTNEGRDIQFIAYGVQPYLCATYEEDLAALASFGFATVMQDCSRFPTDGTVVRINSNEDFSALGFTGTHPRGAFAHKVSSQVATLNAHLTQVHWQIGASGKCTPVAQFDPIVIDDATITRATLHNAGFIEALDFQPGDALLVTRSGGVIPKVLGKTPLVFSDLPVYNITIPKACPECESALERVNDQLFCRNPLCAGSARVEKFAKSMKIKGLGAATIQKLGIETPHDIYKLTQDEINSKIGSALGNKLFKEIQASTTTSLSAFLPAMSIPLFGKTYAQRIQHLTLEQITADACSSANIGNKATANLMAWLQDYVLNPLPITIIPETSSSSQQNKGKVLATGKHPGFTRETLNAKLIELGYTIASSLTKSVQYLIVPDANFSNSKTTQAQTLGVTIITLGDIL